MITINTTITCIYNWRCEWRIQHRVSSLNQFKNYDVVPIPGNGAPQSMHAYKTHCFIRTSIPPYQINPSPIDHSDPTCRSNGPTNYCRPQKHETNVARSLDAPRTVSCCLTEFMLLIHIPTACVKCFMPIPKTLCQTHWIMHLRKYEPRTLETI